MSKRDKPNGKLPLREASTEAGLKHNPFGQLGSTHGASNAPVLSPGPPEPARSTASTVPRGRVLLRREKKHRGGKAVVVIAGLRSHARLQLREIDALAQALKREIGCGGAVEAAGSDTEIVIQGDQPERVADALRSRGFRVEGVTS